MATLKLSWTRPAHLPYPMTWSTFQAKDIDSDELVDYDIRDLTMDRFDEAFHSLTTDYLQNEPMNMALRKCFFCVYLMYQQHKASHSKLLMIACFLLSNEIRLC